MNNKFPSTMDNYPPNPNYNTNPNSSYFTQQAIRAGFVDGDVNRREFQSVTTYDVRNQQYDGYTTSNDVRNRQYDGYTTSTDVRNQQYDGYTTSNDVRNQQYQQYDSYTTSNDVRRRDFDYSYAQNPISDPWELEKERIRKEIIAEETMRRRILEDEVRREMMLQGELPLRHGDGGVGGSWGSMMIEPRRVPNFDHREAEFRGGYSTMPFNRPGFLGSGSGSGSGSGVTLREIKEVNGVGAPPVVSKDNAIVLAKPRANLTHLKRKTMTLPVGGAIEAFKRPKTTEGWRCDLCQITTTSERGLYDHFKGKKHQALEQGTTAPRTGFGTASLQKSIVSSNTAKPLTIFSIPKTPSVKKESYTLSKSKGTSLGKKGNGKARLKAKSPSMMKKKFRFYCEMCQIGANSEVVFDAHMKGKKHLANIGEINKIDGATLVRPSSENVVTEANKVVDKQPGETSGGKRGNQKAKAKKASAIIKPKKKFPFFCEVCKVGANSMIVINAHKKGKKHLAVLAELNKKDETAQVEASAEKAVIEENKELVDEEIIDIDIRKIGIMGTILEVQGNETVAAETIDQVSDCNGIDCE